MEGEWGEKWRGRAGSGMPGVCIHVHSTAYQRINSHANKNVHVENLHTEAVMPRVVLFGTDEEGRGARLGWRAFGVSPRKSDSVFEDGILE